MLVLESPARVADVNGSALLVAHLATVDRAVRQVCRRHRLSREEADSLRSDTYFHLLRNDGGALKSYQGRSQLGTFLVTVIERVFLDGRIAQAGKWRPSAQARRLGHAAVLLERAIHRDGLPLREAGTLVAEQLGMPLADAEVDFLYALLPTRQPRRTVNSFELDRVVTDALDPEQLLLQQESRRDVRRVASGLRRLPADDRRIIWLRYAKGARVKDIGHELGLDGKLVYRRCEQAVARLRAAVLAR